MTVVGVWAGQNPEHPLARAERMFRMAAGERLDILNSGWMQLQSGSDTAPARNDIRDVSHKIAGVAASLGHARLGQIAEDVERLCTTAGAGGTDLQRALRELISALADLTED